MLDLTADLDAFFGPDADFSQAAVWQGRKVYGVFAQPSDDVLGLFGNRPTFACKSSDVKTIARLQTVDVAGQNLRIADWTVDGMQLVTTMILEKQ